ncbi:hypothetical protein B0J11DRAFT_437408, partial [Dendryphion nanum]
MKSTFTLALLNDQTKLSKAILHAVQDTQQTTTRIEAWQGEQEKREKRQEVEKRQKDILAWISSVDYDAQQKRQIDIRLTGTGQWMLASEEFKAWLAADTKGGTLFCEGIPGAGKSIISATVIEYLTQTFANDVTVGVAYVYNTYDHPLEQKPSVLFLNFCKQLGDNRKLAELPAAWEAEFTKQRGVSKPSNPVELLRAAVKVYKKVIFVIDALDECRYCDDNNGEARETMLAELAALRSLTQVYVFTTSRPNSEIVDQFTRHFGEVNPMSIMAQDEDIDRYVNHRMLKFRTRLHEQQDEGIRVSIRTKVRTYAQGMFLLVKLHMDDLTSKLNRRSLKTALEQIQHGSTNLKNQYDSAMERIKNQDADARDLALKVLAWVTRAKKLLKVHELLHALAVREDNTELDFDNIYHEDQLTSFCAGLVTVDPDGSVVRWIHYTTKDYFEDHW